MQGSLVKAFCIGPLRSEAVRKRTVLSAQQHANTVVTLVQFKLNKSLLPFKCCKWDFNNMLPVITKPVYFIEVSTYRLKFILTYLLSYYLYSHNISIYFKIYCISLLSTLTTILSSSSPKLVEIDCPCERLVTHRSTYSSFKFNW